MFLRHDSVGVLIGEVGHEGLDRRQGCRTPWALDALGSDRAPRRLRTPRPGILMVGRGHGDISKVQAASSGGGMALSWGRRGDTLARGVLVLLLPLDFGLAGLGLHPVASLLFAQGHATVLLHSLFLVHVQSSEGIDYVLLTIRGQSFLLRGRECFGRGGAIANVPVRSPGGLATGVRVVARGPGKSSPSAARASL